MPTSPSWCSLFEQSVDLNTQQGPIELPRASFASSQSQASTEMDSGARNSPHGTKRKPRGFRSVQAPAVRPDSRFCPFDEFAKKPAAPLVRPDSRIRLFEECAKTPAVAPRCWASLVCKTTYGMLPLC